MESRVNLSEKPISLPATSITHQLMVDLHGNTPERAKSTVNWYLAHAVESNATEFRFVTGRGNHENARGERGTLYREFPDWISEENMGQISEVKKQDGYYEVVMKRPPKKGSMSPLLENLYKKVLTDQIQFLKEEAEKGNDEAQYMLGYCYQFAIGVVKNEKASL